MLDLLSKKERCIQKMEEMIMYVHHFGFVIQFVYLDSI